MYSGKSCFKVEVEVGEESLMNRNHKPAAKSVTHIIAFASYSLSHKECHLPNSNSQSRLSLTNYICIRLLTSMRSNIYYANIFYDESNKIDVIL
jgi:hypothetical protein